MASGRSLRISTRTGTWRSYPTLRSSNHEVVDLFGSRVGVEHLASRQPDLAVAVDLDALDHHLVALAQHVLDGADALLRDLADMQQAVGTRHDLHERADLDDLLDDPVVVLADLGLHRQPG